MHFLSSFVIGFVVLAIKWCESVSSYYVKYRL